MLISQHVKPNSFSDYLVIIAEHLELFSAAPYWVEELKNVVAGLSEEARFVCKADGDPKPKYTWYINGRSQDSLYETGFRDPRFRLKDPSTIIVSNLRLDDQMNIQCNASNKHGYVFSDAYLDILGEYHFFKLLNF